ncbi:hypothetical protein K439DRAFT_153268 [Ramaria rubella]|nr:hypothetical protein K439DRAFT_153268 [Ramaria rubella]
MCKKVNGCRVYQSEPFVKARPGRYDVSAGRLSRTTHKLRYVHVGNSLRVGGARFRSHIMTLQSDSIEDVSSKGCQIVTLHQSLEGRRYINSFLINLESVCCRCHMFLPHTGTNGSTSGSGTKSVDDLITTTPRTSIG